MKKPFSLAVALLFTGLAVAQENYSTWTYSRAIRVNTTATGANVPGDVARFPLLVRLNAANFAGGFAQAATGGADVRFTQRDGVKRMPHQIERWDAVNQLADIWVLAESVRGNDSAPALRIYWGKTGAADSSSGAKTFTAADGFQAVFHMTEADTIRDATAAGFRGVPVGAAPPTGISSIVGGEFISGGHKNFAATGTDAVNTGGAYRLATKTGGTTSGSFDYTADSAYTISAWVNMNSFPASGSTRRGIITKTVNSQASNAAASSMQYHLRALNPTNNFEFADGNVSGTSGLLADNASILTAQWNYITYTRSTSASGNIYLYNPLVSLTDPSDASGATHQDVDVFLGSFAGTEPAGSATGAGYFDGKLEEVIFSNRARSADWVRLSYETQKPGSTVLKFTTEAPSGVFSRGDLSLRAGFSVEALGSGRVLRLPELGAARAEVSIVDVTGRAVWRRVVESGNREVVWNGRAGNGAAVVPGVYFARLTVAGEGSAARNAETRFLYAP